MSKAMTSKTFLRTLPSYSIIERLTAMKNEFTTAMNSAPGIEKPVVMAALILGMRESADPVLRNAGAMAPLLFLTTGTEKDPLAVTFAEACLILERAELEEKQCHS